MTSFSLGQTPHQMTLELAADTDFIAVLRRTDGADWDVGTAIEVAIGDEVWPAAISGPNATWEVDEVDVNALIATNPKKARLYYSLGTQKVLWASGPVVVR